MQLAHRLRHLAPALRVERHRLAAEARVLVVEPAGRSGGSCLVDGLLERHRDHRSLHDTRDLRPRAVAHLGPSARLVVVLDRPAPGAPLHELDETEVGQRAHVIADVSERSVQLRREIAGARDPILEGAEDLYPKGMRQRLYEAWIAYVADRSHSPPHANPRP